MMMMIAMMSMLLFFRISVLMKSNAAFLHSHHMQASHEIGYEQLQVFSSVLPRKLMLKEMVEGHGDQALVFYNDQKEPPLGDSLERGGEMMGSGEQGSDPTHFTSMDYSHVRRRRPIHNRSPKPNNSP